MLMLGLYSAPPPSGALLLDASDASDCTITRNEHGDERLTARIVRSFTEVLRLYDQTGMLWVVLFDGGRSIWLGRLEDPALFAGADGSGLTIQALGGWRVLSDTKYIALWSKATVTDFRPVLTTEIATAQPDRFTFSAQNVIQIMPQKGAAFGATGAAKQAYYVYISPASGSRFIIGAQFAFTLTVPAINWRGLLIAQNADFSTNSLPWGFTSAGAGTTTRAVHVTFAGVPQVAFFMDLNAADIVLAGETGSAFLRITNLRLVTSTANEISTTLTANRAAGVNVTATVGSTAGMYVGQELCINSANNPSEIVTIISIGSATQFNATFANAYVIGNAVQGFKITADEIIGDLAARASALNPTQLSSMTALIQSPNLDLLNEDYIDADLSEIATHLAALGDDQTPPRRWEVGVDRERRVYFRPRGDAARAWYVDATELSIARTIDDLANIVFATYQDASGRRLLLTSANDAASIARYGLSRIAIVSTDTTSTIEAGKIRDTALADHKDPLPQADIQFDAIYDATGGRYDPWEVEPGDTLTIRNLPIGAGSGIDRVRTFRITRTELDLTTNRLAVEPEAPPPTMEVMLARRAEGIAS